MAFNAINELWDFLDLEASCFSLSRRAMNTSIVLFIQLDFMTQRSRGINRVIYECLI